MTLSSAGLAASKVSRQLGDGGYRRAHTDDDHVWHPGPKIHQASPTHVHVGWDGGRKSEDVNLEACAAVLVNLGYIVAPCRNSLTGRRYLDVTRPIGDR